MKETFAASTFLSDNFASGNWIGLGVTATDEELLDYPKYVEVLSSDVYPRYDPGIDAT